jgi:hypothetical protein
VSSLLEAEKICFLLKENIILLFFKQIFFL